MAAYRALIGLARAQPALRISGQMQELLKADVGQLRAVGGAAGKVQGGGHHEGVTFGAVGKGGWEGRGCRRKRYTLIEFRTMFAKRSIREESEDYS